MPESEFFYSFELIEMGWRVWQKIGHIPPVEIIPDIAAALDVPDQQD